MPERRWMWILPRGNIPRPEYLLASPLAACRASRLHFAIQPKTHAVHRPQPDWR
jgi:hypothetical protein